MDGGESLKQMVDQMEKFFDDDIHAALLVLGGVAMSFHFELLHNSLGGVPSTLAVGDPVSGKSKAVEAAMAIFDERDSIGCKLHAG